MSEYEKELFEFITQPDNFNTASDIANYLPTVKRNLQADFWEQVKIETERKLPSDLPGWECWINDDIFYKYSKFGIYDPNWPKSGETDPPLFICYENLTGRIYEGLSLDCTLAGWDHKMIRRHFGSLPIRTQFTNQTDWWCMWRYHSYDFSNQKDLQQILPANRETIVLELSSRIIDIAKQINQSTDIIELLNNTKIPV